MKRARRSFKKVALLFRSERHDEANQAGVITSSTPGAVRHKIVMMGAAKVGKSSLISQFLYGTFSPKYKRTIEEMHHGDFNVGGVSLTLDILDTSEGCAFTLASLHTHHVRSCLLMSRHALTRSHNICGSTYFVSRESVEVSSVDKSFSFLGYKATTLTANEGQVPSRKPIAQSLYHLFHCSNNAKVMFAGSYEFPAMRALSISSAEAFVLVYDITNADTFEEVRTLRDQIHETKGNTAVPIVVVGNKVDLAEEGSRQVEFSTTESVVTVDWENGFVESSAKDNTNVTQVFKELLAQAKVKYNLSPALRKKRRQSMARHSISEGSTASPSTHSIIPSPSQLQHLEQIRERHSGSKRNSCTLS
uniref:GTP-binding protein Rhes n=1 Tax=Timema bartmani TaxID=61472 RepID=A0A7R9I4R8_9NEOP|nr:unnamed protein product [Timema bartmani]